MRDEPPSAYAAHERLVTAARQRPELWRLVVGLALVAVVVIAFGQGLFAVVVSLGPYDWALEFLRGETPVGMLILLSSFGFVTLGVTLAARLLHHRSLSSVVGLPGLAIRQFWQVLRALLLLGLVMAILPPYGLGAPLVSNLAFSTWLLMLPFSAIAILIQTSAEELLFRGYIQQSLAARFRSPVIWMGLPSMLFAVGHYAPGVAGENAVLVAIWAGLFGLFAADLTARAGTLGPAIALHFFNNVVAILIISLPDSLSGLALFLVPFEMSDTAMLRQWLLVDFAIMIVSWLAARLALRR